MKKIKVPEPKKEIVITVRVNADEMRQILMKAHGYASGNVSEWIRFSALNFKPSKQELHK